VRKGS
jgi:hypothetical protein